VGNVIRLRRPGASAVVIAPELGYLRPRKRYKPTAILRAIELLKTDLWHAGVIEAGDLTDIDKAANGSVKQEVS
jgi:hypothetical protein